MKCYAEEYAAYKMPVPDDQLIEIIATHRSKAAAVKKAQAHRRSAPSSVPKPFIIRHEDGCWSAAVFADRPGSRGKIKRKKLMA